MKHNVRRIIMLSAVLALIGLLVMGTAAFAQGPDGATQARSQLQSVGTPAQNGSGYGPGDGTGPIGGGGFGPGPKGQCLDLNHNGICDCLE